MDLRGYQHKLHDEIYEAWRAGYRNVLGVLPTGGGKTVTFAHIVREEPGHSVVLAHRAELVAQMSLALAREKVRHRVIGPPSLARLCVNAHIAELAVSYINPNAKTAVGSVQSIATYKDTAWFDQIGLWVHDEAHHLLRDGLFGRAVAKFKNAKGLGVTATPGRADGRGLGRHADGVFDVLVLGPTPRDLINQGYLSHYKIFAPPSTLDLTGVHLTPSGDFSKPELKTATQKSTVLGDTATHYAKHAFGQSGLTFADCIENAIDIAMRYKGIGVSAEVLTGKTPDSLRSDVINRFKACKLDQIVSVALIDEGFDCPGVMVVSDAAATQSFNRFAQRFGRGLRVMANKSHMTYFDHVGNTLRHGLPDAPRYWSLDRMTKRSKGSLNEVPLRTCTNPNEECYQPYPRINKCCPHCGYYPEPASRSSPEYVDGDLTELDEATLRKMRGEIDRINAPAIVPKNLDHIAQLGIRKRHWERQGAHATLRNALAWWGGLMHSQGNNESTGFRIFNFKFGIDIGTAQTLPAREALELVDKINIELLKNGIDGSVNAELYLINAEG